jgi:hypothetical protein
VDCLCPVNTENPYEVRIIFRRGHQEPPNKVLLEADLTDIETRKSSPPIIIPQGTAGILPAFFVSFARSGWIGDFSKG